MGEGGRLALTGDAEMMEDSFGSLLEALILALLLIYIVLASQFNSFIHPLTIMTALPFALSGALITLYLTNQGLSIMSFIGLIMLMGIVTKNSILLIDFALQQIRAGAKVTDALVESSRVRLRPILMTTNCIVTVKDAYRDRIFTTGPSGYPGLTHIDEPENGKSKDFSEIIELAKTCKPPVEIETGKIVGGFAHNQVLVLADKIVAAVKSGDIKRFIVMAGCDGRHKSRDYYKEVAENLPKDAIILTAGCAKYRYNKLNLGDIGGIPRVLDAGQCNDSYSLAVIALKLKEVFGVDSINDLPISFDIAWYEQKAVTVLLALLYLGVKNIRLGPTLPAFLSPNVVKVLVDNFDIKPQGEVMADIDAMMSGK
jgi:hydroxylamine reductase (hybrid-cluster protein)